MPPGDKLHMCIFDDPHHTDSSQRNYRLAMVHNSRYCEPLKNLTDHFALPFQVNMLDFERN